MAKKSLPAWQQVLRNVPEAKNGRDAWEKLNEEEQSAVMDFLTEHCGEDKAQSALEESCAMVKHGRGWQTTWGICWALLIMAIYVGVALWLDKYVDDVHRYLWVVVCLHHTIRAWKGNPQGTMQIIWREHVNTHYGTAIALQDMHRTLGQPSEVLRNKKDLIFWAILMILWIALIVWDIFG